MNKLLAGSIKPFICLIAILISSVVFPQKRFSISSIVGTVTISVNGKKYKIQNQFMDRPFLSIRTKQTPNDSVYAWHSDAACMTEHKLLSTELWRLGIPPKCFYWSNITSILFFKTDPKSKQPKNDDVGAFVEKKNVVELATVYLRLFDNQRFIITFDEEHRSVQVNYE